VLNGLHVGVIAEMIAAVDQIRDGQSQARCLILTGTGRGFSSGADLSGGGAGGGGGGGGPWTRARCWKRTSTCCWSG
jgi:2-(1,2-epoxy-1,2-dihydrophenyl)acetyl-CoA isomerase